MVYYYYYYYYIQQQALTLEVNTHLSLQKVEKTIFVADRQEEPLEEIK